MKKTLIALLAINLFATLIFGLAYGLSIANPTNSSWMLVPHDVFNFFVHWAAFRNGPWLYPLGSIPDLIYPAGTSIGNGDGMPWLAILAKLLLPKSAPLEWHYFGLWMYGGFLLQGSLGFLLLRRFGLPLVHASLGAAFYIVSAPLLFRHGHVALMGQWLILASFHVYLSALRWKNSFWVCILTTTLVLFTAGINPYLWTMVFIVVTAAWIARSLSLRNSKSALTALGVLTLQLIISVIAFRAFRYFNMGGTRGYGFGLYHSDVLTFINPRHLGRFLPDIRSSGGDYEGLAYLGFGMLLLVGYWIYRTRKETKHLFPIVPDGYRPWLWAALASTVFALSKDISVAAHTLIVVRAYDYLEPLPSTFRSSGRFIWIPYYSLLTAVLIWFSRRPNHRRTAGALAILLILQIADSKLVLHARSLKHFFTDPKDSTEQITLTGEEKTYWDQRLSPVKSIWVVTRGEMASSESTVRKYTLLSAINGKRTNVGQSSRYNDAVMAHWHTELMSRLQSGQLTHDEVVVLSAGAKVKGLRCDTLTDHQICWRAASR